MEVLDGVPARDEYLINVFNSSIKDGMVYGRITIKYLNGHTIKAFADNYGFEMKHPWKENLLRNIITKIGSIIAGDGEPFDIYIYGTKELKR